MSELFINRLNLRLPSGFEKRADAIARETSRQLSKLPMEQSMQLDRLNIPRLQIHGGETNRVIARRIAQSIHAQIGASKGGSHD